MTRLRLVLAIAAALLVAAAAPAGASAAGPALRVFSSAPDYVTPGKGLLVYVNALNVGDEPLSGDLLVTYTFPAGIAPADPQNLTFNGPAPECQTVGQVVECTVDVTGTAPGAEVRLRTTPLVEPGAEGQLTGQIEVSGGGAPGAVARPLSLIAGPIGPFSVKALDLAIADAPALPSSQGGSDPTEIATDVRLSSDARSNLNPPFFNPIFLVTSPTESFRDVIVHVPPGMIGNPTSTPVRCTAAQLTTQLPLLGIPSCPPESQIGLARLYNGDIVPLFNIEPPFGHPGEFGFYYLGIVVTLDARVRPSDNGIDLVTERAPSSVPIPEFEVTLWGVPADDSYDPLRSSCLHGGFGNNPENAYGKDGLCPSQAPRAAFLRTPTSCTGAALPWSIEIDTYQHPGVFARKDSTTPATQNCDVLPFDPSLSLVPDSHAAHSPAGLDVNLTMPQESGPDGLAQADVRSATVTLPEGVAINPASADGLAACGDEQLRLGQEGPSDCPDASKLGSVEVTTPLLDHPLGGSVFLRSQASADPESGQLYRLAIELRSDRDGLAIRLPGSLRVNKDTGRLTAGFDDLPQLPFESMQLHFKSGARAPLATPSTCGTYATRAEVTSWARPNQPVGIDSSFTIDQGCQAPKFDPGFEAGVANATAGEFSPFLLRVTRDDGEPNVSRIETTLPEGELAKLAGVPPCPEAPATTGACPASSQVGNTTVGAGNGTSPLYLPQPGKQPTAVYLAGPYKGGPYSLVVKVPAQAGPFDLGTVAVRSALHVDPETTQVTVASDPLPQIIAGVPIAYRDVRVDVDRPGFTLNPTRCEPKSVSGAIASTGGEVANVSDRFQVHDCAALGFKPKLSIALAGRTTRSGHPALTAVLRMPKKGPNANIARTSVALPHSEFLAQSHLNTTCTRVQYAANGGGGAGCPKGSVYGHARAFTPLLDYPLEGPVYLRSNGGDRNLPDLVASLGGQIHVDLVGFIDTDKKTGGIRTTFANVPDAPVSKFVLKMPGGKKSLLENSTNICGGRHRAIVKMDGQNGKIHDFRPLVKAKCGKGARKGRSGGGRTPYRR